jgi:hypothetical protein
MEVVVCEAYIWEKTQLFRLSQLELSQSAAISFKRDL